MPEIVNGKEFLTAKEAAKFLKMSISRMYQLIATEKTLPVHRIGTKVLFEKTELSNWVLSQK